MVCEMWFVRMVVIFCEVLLVCLMVVLWLVYSVSVLIVRIINVSSVFSVLMIKGWWFVDVVSCWVRG